MNRWRRRRLQPPAWKKKTAAATTANSTTSASKTTTSTSTSAASAGCRPDLDKHEILAVKSVDGNLLVASFSGIGLIGDSVLLPGAHRVDLPGPDCHHVDLHPRAPPRSSPAILLATAPRGMALRSPELRFAAAAGLGALSRPARIAPSPLAALAAPRRRRGRSPSPAPAPSSDSNASTAPANAGKVLLLRGGKYGRQCGMLVVQLSERDVNAVCRWPASPQVTLAARAHHRPRGPGCHYFDRLLQ